MSDPADSSPASLMRTIAQSLAQMPAPGAEARILTAHVLGVPSTQLWSLDAVTPEQQRRLWALVRRRLSGEPVQHLTGRAPFRYLELEVGPGAFIPRPETEVMVGWCIDRLRELPRGEEPRIVVDLCTGSGAIAAALADELITDPAALSQPFEIHAVELSSDALAWAERNLSGTGVHLLQADLVDALPELDGRCDLVVCNPPYVPLESWEGVPAEVRDYDPDMALFSGPDGLDAWRSLAVSAHRLLRPGGILAGEHADVQGETVPALLVQHGGWAEVRDHRDLTDRPRFTTARKLSQDDSRAF